ncbi:MAG: hypothetical protein CK426_08200 [Legionella sp.]|nr:MAG: hypothetical protein CK423_01105 [Legionella sp.]PJD97411.1 MAG: hypothetical protein CK426_08200 [Legionella sp.]
MEAKSLIRLAYELTMTATLAKNEQEERIKALWEHQRRYKSQTILDALNFQLKQLNSLDPVLFTYWTQEKREAQIRLLEVTKLLLAAQEAYEATYQKTVNQEDYTKASKECDTYLQSLRTEGFVILPKAGQHFAYLYLKAGFVFAKSMEKLTNIRSIADIRDNMSWFNQGRLCWVWDSSFLKNILEQLPPDFFYTQQATKMVYLPDPYTGTLSWGLYYFRFAINLGLLLKHTMAGPWMKDELKTIPWPERFMTQWEQRKFLLLNDLIWATGNLACFFWLCGSKGTWGDILTIALLTFDLAVAFWDYEEQQVAQKQQEQAYLADIERLNEQITTITQELTKQDEQKKIQLQIQLIELQRQLAALQKAYEHSKSQWETNKLLLAINTAYAGSLLLSFVLLTAPYFPLAANTLLSVTLVGAALCFAVTLINNAVKGHIELTAQKSEIKRLTTERQEKIAALKDLIKQSDEEPKKKILFLEIQKNLLDTQYQQIELTRKQLHLARAILIESLIPPVVLLSLVFLPTGIGVGILVTAALISAASYFLIEALFKEDPKTLPPFDEAKYQDFLDQLDTWEQKVLPRSASGYFSEPKPAQSLVLPQPTDELTGNKKTN